MDDLAEFMQRTENLSTFDLLDETAYRVGGSATLVRVHRASTMGERYRVTVHRDQARDEAYARVDVLTPSWVWSELVDAPPAYWWTDTTSVGDPEQIAKNLGWVADELLIRGHRIMTAGVPKPSKTLREALQSERFIAGDRIRQIIGAYTVDNVHGLTQALEDYAAKLQAR